MGKELKKIIETIPIPISIKHFSVHKRRNYELVGAALIAAQKVEFITHGIVSHFKNVSTNKKFKNLTPSIFLDDSEESRKLRRQTLGEIFDIIKELKFFPFNERLDSYLKNRNVLVHELWRKYLKNRSLNSSPSGLTEFCISFITESEKIENLLKGLLYGIGENIAREINTPIPENIEKLKPSFAYLSKCVEAKELLDLNST